MVVWPWAATVAKAPLSPLPFLPLLSPQSSTAAASAAAAAASAAAFSAVSASSAPVASVAGASAGNCSARGGGQNTGPVLQWPPPREARAPRPLSPPDWLLPSRQPPSQPAPAPWQPSLHPPLPLRPPLLPSAFSFTAMISLAFTSASAIHATFATALSFTPKGFGGDELRSTTLSGGDMGGEEPPAMGGEEPGGHHPVSPAMTGAEYHVSEGRELALGFHMRTVRQFFHGPAPRSPQLRAGSPSGSIRLRRSRSSAE